MISTSTTALREAVAKARLLSSRQSVIPVYGMILVRATQDSEWLTLTAGAVDAEIAVDIDATIDNAIAVCVDAERLGHAVAVPGEVTKLAIEGERLVVRTGRSVFRLATRPAEDFPPLASTGEKIAAFECAWLADAIKRVLPFTGTSDSPNMAARGISLKGGGGTIRVEGTTMSKCASLVREVGEKGAFSVMLPRRVCEALVDIAPTRVVLKGGSALFLGENLQLVSTYLKAQMPDVDRVFPEAPVPITVSRSAFVEAVRAVSAVADVVMKRGRPIQLEADGLGTVVLSTAGAEGDGRMEIETLEESPAYSGSFDGAFLLALAAAGDSDALKMIPGVSPHRLRVDEREMRAVVVGYVT